MSRQARRQVMENGQFSGGQEWYDDDGDYDDDEAFEEPLDESIEDDPWDDSAILKVQKTFFILTTIPFEIFEFI